MKNIKVLIVSLLLCLFLVNPVTSYASGVKVTKDTFGSNESIHTVQIGYDVTDIEDGSFSDLKNLSKIEVDNKNPYYSTYDGCLYNKDFTKLLCVPQGRSSVLILYSTKSYAEHALDGMSQERKDRLITAINNGFKEENKTEQSSSVQSVGNSSQNQVDLTNYDYSQGSSFYENDQNNNQTQSSIPDSSDFQQYVYTGSDGKVTFKYTGSGHSTIVVPEGVTKIAGFASDPWTFNDEITCVYLPSTLRTMSVSNMYCQEELGWDTNGYNVLHQCRNLQNVYGSSSSYSGNGSSVTRPGGITVWVRGQKTAYNADSYK